MQNNALDHLVAQFVRLPGIGHKTARRLAFFILKMEAAEAGKIAQAIIDAKARLSFCRVCNNLTEQEICSICARPDRDTQKMLVLDEPSTLHAIERTGEYKGLYHVLLGMVAPLSEMAAATTAQATQRLVERIKKEGITEVIIATSPNMDGEAVALYLAREIRSLGAKVSRIACGIPVGADLEYADEVTLARSLSGRREMTGLSGEVG